MGLDISYCDSLTYVGPLSAEYDGDGLWLHNPDVPAHGDGIAPGIYRAGSEQHFRAGSYSGYNWWRANLRRLAVGGNTFGELINFSDCEGFIGPKTSAKLAKDFADWAERAEAFAATLGEESGYWLARYREWRRAFEAAARGGVVKFH